MNIDKNRVKEEVKEQMKALMKAQSNSSIVEESVGSKIAKTLGTLVGASIGGSVGYGTGMAIGTLTTLAAFPLLPASAVVALPIGAAAGLGVLGLLGGGSVGLDLARRVSEKDSEKLVRELVVLINKRDEAIKKLAETPDETIRAKLEKEIASNTDKQVSVSKKLRKELNWELKKGLITQVAFEYADKILKKAEEGRITYISK